MSFVASLCTAGSSSDPVASAFTQMCMSASVETMAPWAQRHEPGTLVASSAAVGACVGPMLPVP
jgi:hypothetical protein